MVLISYYLINWKEKWWVLVVDTTLTHKFVSPWTIDEDVDVTLRFEILVYSEIGEYDLFRM